MTSTTIEKSTPKRVAAAWIMGILMVAILGISLFQYFTKGTPPFVQLTIFFALGSGLIRDIPALSKTKVPMIICVSLSFTSLVIAIVLAGMGLD